MAEGNYLVGVDIGSSGIKLCALKDVRGKKTLVKFGYHPLPPQTIVEGHVMNNAAVVDGINQLFTQLKLKRRDVALAVSGHAVIIKRLSLPLMTDAELVEQIPWEAEQHIPFDIKDVELDYEVLRQRPEQGQMDVLLVAAKKEEINDTSQLAREAKLRPMVIDVDPFAVQNTFETNYGMPRQGTVALINIGASLTTINVLSAGIPAFTRNIVNGGNAITDEIQKRLGIAFEEAETYKTGALGAANDPRSVVPNEVPQIIRQMVESLAGEILRSLDFYLATTGDREINKIYIAGGTANLPEVGAAIERRTKAPVELLDPFRDIAVDLKEVNADLLNMHRAQVCVAIGLALRKDREKAVSGSMLKINLLPRGEARRGSQQSNSAASLLLVGVVGSLVLLISGLFLFQTTQQSEVDTIKSQNTQIQGQIDAIKSRVADHQKVRDELAEIRRREEAITGLQQARTGPTAMLVEISHILSPNGRPTVEPRGIEDCRQNPACRDRLWSTTWEPHRLWITNFEENNRNVKISGEGRTPDDVGELMRRLQWSLYFQNLRLDRTESTTSSGLAVQRFTIVAKVRY